MGRGTHRSRTIVHRISRVLLSASLLVAAFFFVKSCERDHYIDDLIASTAKEKIAGRDDSVIALARAIHKRTSRVIEAGELDWYSRLETNSFFNITAATSLKYGGYGLEGHSQLGPCGTMSRILLNTCWRLDIPARKLHIPVKPGLVRGGHTVVEFYHDGQWRVIAPSNDAYVWHKPDGTLATREDLRTDRELFAQVFTTHPGFKYTFDDYSNVRWNKLPSFAVEIIEAVLGEERFRRMQTPKLYDQPRTLLCLAACVCSVVFGLLFWSSRPSPFRARTAALSPSLVTEAEG